MVWWLLIVSCDEWIFLFFYWVSSPCLMYSTDYRQQQTLWKYEKEDSKTLFQVRVKADWGCIHTHQSAWIERNMWTMIMIVLPPSLKDYEVNCVISVKEMGLHDMVPPPLLLGEQSSMFWCTKHNYQSLSLLGVEKWNHNNLEASLKWMRWN